jgi:tetratricopeptide (TPR) repeat protein
MRKLPDKATRVGRNLRILEAEYAAAGGALEPRRLFYLARENADAGNTERAIAIFQEYLKVGTWADECCMARVQLAELYRQREQYQEAIDADLQELKVHPRWPHAYFGLARSYYFLRDWPKVIHWCDLGRQMPVPDSLLFLAPADYRTSWIIYYTNALFHTGQVAAALAWTRRALALGADRRWHVDNLFVFGRLQDQSGPVAIEPSPPDLPTYAVIPVRDGHELTRPLLGQLGRPPERVIVIDNGSSVPAREALAGLARVTDAPPSSLSALWNLGLDLVAAECRRPHNVAVLNNDLEVPPNFLTGLVAGLRARPDHFITYPDAEEHLTPGICDPTGRMTGFAFMLRGEAGLRADPQFAWWYGDDDLEWQARQRGKVVRVGGVHVRHLTPNQRTSQRPDLQAMAAEDLERFLAKWCADDSVLVAYGSGDSVQVPIRRNLS